MRFQIGTHVQVRLLLGGTGPDEEDLDLLGRRGVIEQIGTAYPEESYGVRLDEFSGYVVLAFRALELVEVRE
jgi:hypothetical protein